MTSLKCLLKKQSLFEICFLKIDVSDDSDQKTISLCLEENYGLVGDGRKIRPVIGLVYKALKGMVTEILRWMFIPA